MKVRDVPGKEVRDFIKDLGVNKMSEWFESLPKVRVYSDPNPIDSRIFINGQEWTQWSNKIVVTVEQNNVAHVTLGFFAHIEGEIEEVDVEV